MEFGFDDLRDCKDFKGSIEDSAEDLELELTPLWFFKCNWCSINLKLIKTVKNNKCQEAIIEEECLHPRVLHLYQNRTEFKKQIQRYIKNYKWVMNK